MESFVTAIVAIISKLGYIGIMVGMAIESSFIPFPSEVVMIPAGYLVHKGEMNAFLVIFFGIFGTLIGASINYFIAASFLKNFLIKYGKYFFISQKTLLRAENFFKSHGDITTFTGRLIPGIRQLISIPAGIFKMPFGKFIVYTALGSGIWISILVAFGYVIGEKKAFLIEYSSIIQLGAILISIAFAFFYIFFKRRKTVLENS